MLVFTAKFNKKRAVIAVLVLAALLCAVILLAGRADRQKTPVSALSAVVRDNEQRVAYLNSLGWQVEETAMEEQDIVIPREFSNVYEEYNKLQISQGFDLKEYGGIEATRYTYKITNYPSAGVTAVADIIVYKNEIIAGDVQSNALDGFMLGLKFPE
ncbi:MAG: DUF4830 domain-containing protein [Oscillospiraceae bacterium]|jgi:outer membrane murein-binding lipoprotein Lpp|nr:DUF4830 domain-containing protein [Oscillospiraceae bacterium]